MNCLSLLQKKHTKVLGIAAYYHVVQKARPPKYYEGGNTKKKLK